jgi:RNA polymerase sigma-70 factor (ECF subfamily)
VDVNELMDSNDGPHPAERSDEVARARSALRRLRPRQRQVIEMHWLEGRPFPEVAAALGEQLSTVKVRAHRAYRELREVLETAAG